MLTEAEIQKYERAVHLYTRAGKLETSHVLAHVLQSYRELQAENARLREQLTKTGEKNVVRNY